MAVFPLDDWSIASIRLTAFSARPLRGEDLKPRWHEIVGSQPASVTRTSTPEQIQESGPLDGTGNLIYAVQPLRADWVWAANPVPSPTFDLLGPFTETLAKFNVIGKQWLEGPLFPVNRLAFGAVLHHPETSRVDGYERLGRYLESTLHVSPSTTRELLLQLNIPRRSSVVTGLEINRLQKWGVLTVNFMAFDAGGRPVNQSLDYWASSLELDISTPADPAAPLHQEVLGQLRDELQSYAIGIAADGDKA